MLLREKVIVVTGGGSGIGRECVLACAREGARVAVLDVNTGNAEETAHAAGGASISVACDVGKECSVKEAVQEVEQHLVASTRFTTMPELRAPQKLSTKPRKRNGTG